MTFIPGIRSWLSLLLQLDTAPLKQSLPVPSSLMKAGLHTWEDAISSTWQNPGVQTMVAWLPVWDPEGKESSKVWLSQGNRGLRMWAERHLHSHMYVCRAGVCVCLYVCESVHVCVCTCISRVSVSGVCERGLVQPMSGVCVCMCVCVCGVTLQPSPVDPHSPLCHSTQCTWPHSRNDSNLSLLPQPATPGVLTRVEPMWSLAVPHHQEGHAAHQTSHCAAAGSSHHSLHPRHSTSGVRCCHLQIPCQKRCTWNSFLDRLSEATDGLHNVLVCSWKSKHQASLLCCLQVFGHAQTRTPPTTQWMNLICHVWNHHAQSHQHQVAFPCVNIVSALTGERTLHWNKAIQWHIVTSQFWVPRDLFQRCCSVNFSFKFQSWYCLHVFNCLLLFLVEMVSLLVCS